MPFSLIFSVGSAINFYACLIVLSIVTWQVLIVVIPMVYATICLQVMNMSSLLNNIDKGTKFK
jgi:hypothetical protein